MPISVSCPCGARFSVRGEWAGRRSVCPQCGATLAVEAGGAYVVEQPAKKAGAKFAQRMKNQPRYKPGLWDFISPYLAMWKVRLAIALAILVPTLTTLVRLGPVKAREEWAQMSPRVENDIRDVMHKGMVDHIEKAWTQVNIGYESAFSKPREMPTIEGLVLDAPTIMFSAPEKVSFRGTVSMAIPGKGGKAISMDMRGVCFTKARRVEGEISLGEPGEATLKISGHIADGAVVME